MITVVGGTYREYCFEPIWNETFGSGLRACHAINQIHPTEKIKYYTFADDRTTAYLNHIDFIALNISSVDKTVEFQYAHPLAYPAIFPRPDTIDKSRNMLIAKGGNILCYGMIEGHFNVDGEKVVYDPQSPALPLSFRESGSKANMLAYVINWKEAQLLSNKTELNHVIRFFFEEEDAAVLVIKMGAKGALVVTDDGKEATVPVYQTQQVWPIGSGDVFAAVFALKWFETGDALGAAAEASKKTAAYCNSQNISLIEDDAVVFEPLNIKNFDYGQVYLAGPFFTFAQRWLVDQVRTALLDCGLKVFSPLHDVGHGIASEVVPADLKALDASSIVFAIIDGLDSGTLFEIGYAVKAGLPVIGYVENESEESVKMLVGTDCLLENDLTTAVYKCFWKLAIHDK